MIGDVDLVSESKRQALWVCNKQHQSVHHKSFGGGKLRLACLEKSLHEFLESVQIFECNLIASWVEEE